MADPLSVGGLVLGLPGLFVACIQSFDLMQSGRSHGERYELLLTRLAVQRYQFFVWGQDVGLVETPEQMFVQEPLRGLVTRVLHNLYRIFENTDSLATRYGLKKVNHASDTQLALPSNQCQPSRASYEAFLMRIKKGQSELGTTKLVRWAIHDEAKFHTMIVEIESLVASLKAIASPDNLRFFSDGLRLEKKKKQLDSSVFPTPSLDEDQQEGDQKHSKHIPIPSMYLESAFEIGEDSPVA